MLVLNLMSNFTFSSCLISKARLRTTVRLCRVVLRKHHPNDLWPILAFCTYSLTRLLHFRTPFGYLVISRQLRACTAHNSTSSSPFAINLFPRVHIVISHNNLSSSRPRVTQHPISLKNDRPICCHSLWLCSLYNLDFDSSNDCRWD
jgi:hypothetical protein